MLLTALLQSCGKVMFSVVSPVSHFVHGAGGRGGGSHATITRDALDLTVQLPASEINGGDHWRPVQTCSFGTSPGVASGSGQ